ncbi:MAG: serine/threonine protein kinase [Planctomycetota bacterium]|nr:MAG: serine/threonine protein kinase [Planctomycetota bacterium]
MIQYFEIWVARKILEKRLLEAAALKHFLSKANESRRRLKDFFIQEGILTEGIWEQCLEEAIHYSSWPERRELFHQDNVNIYNLLRRSNLFHEQTLRENLHICQNLFHPKGALRLDDLLLKKGILQESYLSKLFHISREVRFVCPHCHFQIVLAKFYPWWNPPCIFCSNSLQKELSSISSHSSQYLNFPSLGKYRILEKIGEGGMGVIYKALDTQTQELVAIKLLSPTELNSQEQRDRFLKEVRITSQLSHPNIIPILDYGEIHQNLFLVMPFIEGCNLRDYVEKRKTKSYLSLRKALTILYQVADAVEYAHRRGILHRDIKPENIMITSEGKPILMDFGLAFEQGTPSDMRLTKTGYVLGSPEFMAPEQIKAQKTLTPATDIYALGGTLYFMLSGTPPFCGEDILELFNRVVHERVPSLSKINPLVPRKVENLLYKCLEKSPQKRYSSARELAEELNQLLNESPSRHRSYAPLFVLGIVFLLGVFFFFYFQRPTSPSPKSDAFQTSLASRRALSKKASSVRGGSLRQNSLRKKLQLLYQQGDWFRVRKRWESCIKRLAEKDREVELRKIFLLNFEGEYWRAKELFQSLSSSDSELYQILRAYFAIHRRDYREAKKILQKIPVSSSSHELYFCRALYEYYGAGKPKQALASIAKALELCPNNARYLEFRIFLLFHQSLFHEAERWAIQALKAHPKHYVFFHFLAIIYKKIMPHTRKFSSFLKKAIQFLQQRRQRSINLLYELRYLHYLQEGGFVEELERYSQNFSHSKVKKFSYLSYKARADFIYTSLYYNKGSLSIPSSSERQKYYKQAAELYLRYLRSFPPVWKENIGFRYYYYFATYNYVSSIFASKSRRSFGILERLFKSQYELFPIFPSSAIFLAKFYEKQRKHALSEGVLRQHLNQFSNSFVALELLRLYEKLYLKVRSSSSPSSHFHSSQSHLLSCRNCLIRKIFTLIQHPLRRYGEGLFSFILAVEGRDFLLKNTQIPPLQRVNFCHEVIELSTRAIQLYPRLSGFRLARAYSYYELGKYSLAERDLQYIQSSTFSTPSIKKSVGELLKLVQEKLSERKRNSN